MAKQIKELTQREFARLGGNSKLKKYGKKVFSEMGKKSGESRRKKAVDNSVDNNKQLN